MGYRREPLAPGEWYHCYTRGIDKRKTFENGRDYKRFIEAMYLSNSTSLIDRGTFQHKTHQDILAIDRKRPLVAVGAYALMGNHFHLLLKEIEEDGITKFMQRVGTSYTMYFNIKYERIGSLFVKPFRSKHVHSDRYLQRIVQYIHLNPIEIFEPKWKEGISGNAGGLIKKLKEYPYSSLPDYLGLERPQGILLAWDEINNLLYTQMPPLKTLLSEMQEYYESISLNKKS